MHIQVNDTTTFRGIQDVFATYYPWLRLEFYRIPHQPGEASAERQAIPPGTTVGSFRSTHVCGLLEISPLEQVQQLEQELQQRFGIPAQVLYKKHHSWTPTIGTDTFTLKELNELSRNASDEPLLSDYEAQGNEPDTRPWILL